MNPWFPTSRDVCFIVEIDEMKSPRSARRFRYYVARLCGQRAGSEGAAQVSARQRQSTAHDADGASRTNAARLLRRSRHAAPR